MHQPRITKSEGWRQEPITFVTVGWYWTSVEAWLTRNRLAAEGIDAFVVDEFMATTYWLYANAIGAIKVQVPQEQVERALDVLDGGNPIVFKLVPVAPQTNDQPQCRHCGSSELYHEPFEVRFVFLLWFMMGVPIPVPSTAVECYDCGRRDGPPTSYELPFRLRTLLVVILVAGVILGIMWVTGRTWFESAADQVHRRFW